MFGVRRKIILDFAKWATLSALRRAPINSRAGVYRLLDQVAFDEVLRPRPAITREEFDDWHKTETEALSARVSRSKLPIGWSAKLINVYLKTAAYVGDLGRPGLREVLHPPIDAGLREGFRMSEALKERADILAEVCCARWIKDITTYATYQRIIAGCRDAARVLKCSLVEVEHLWRGSITPEHE